MNDVALPLVDAPHAAGFDDMAIERAYAVIDRFCNQGLIPGAVAIIGRPDAVLKPRHFGHRAIVPRLEPNQVETIYDCASLTKVVVTAPLIWSLIDRGMVRLDDPVSLFVPGFASQYHADDHGDDRKKVTIRHLLTHTSGLPAWTPLYREGNGWEPIIQAICQTALEHAPATQVVYSCLGYMLLGEVIQQVTGQPLDVVASEWIFTPLGMKETWYNPPSLHHARIAPTEIEKGTPIRGVVHDENARAMGGVSGNAGLFSTATDLARFATMMLLKGKTGGVKGADPDFNQPTDTSFRRIVSAAIVDEAIRNHTSHLGQSRGLGWVIKADDTYTSAGDLFSPHSFGHTGFTGTSLWCDPRRNVFVVLLTNSVHLSRENVAHRRLRPLFHNAVAAALTE